MIPRRRDWPMRLESLCFEGGVQLVGLEAWCQFKNRGDENRLDPFFPLSVSSSDDLHFGNKMMLGIDQCSLPVQYMLHRPRIVDANWKGGPSVLDSQVVGNEARENQHYEGGADTNASVAISDTLAIPGKDFSPWQLTRHIRKYSDTVTHLFKIAKPSWHEQVTVHPAWVTGQLCRGAPLHCSLPRPGVRLEKPILGSKLPGYGGTQVADGLILEKKKICQLAQKTLVWEKNVSLWGRQLLRFHLLHPRKAGAGYASSVAAHVSIFPNTHIRVRTRYSLISTRKLACQGPMGWNKVRAWWE